VRPARPSPAEALRTQFMVLGELRGHDHRDVIDYAVAMGELAD
jgi:hypothetical protein